MQFVNSLSTGTPGYFLEPLTAQTIAVESDAHCLFAADSENSDIAIFAGPKFQQVRPSFTDSQLEGWPYGINLALDPNGEFLYTSWSTTSSQNLAVLAIAFDCSLSIVGNIMPLPDYVSSLTFTRDGKVLVATFPNEAAVQAYRTSSSGTLTTLGDELVFNDMVNCTSVGGCEPAASDVTDDDIYWIWANGASTASTFTAVLTSGGFTNVELQNYPDTTVTNLGTPRFSPQAAQTDVGNLYLGAIGFYGPFLPGGIIVTTFDKGTTTYQNTTVNTIEFVCGTPQTIGKAGSGSPIVQLCSDINGVNTFYPYTVNGGTLTPANTLQAPVSGSDIQSTTVLPKRP
jgi:hypothetical protein